MAKLIKKFNPENKKIKIEALIFVLINVFAIECFARLIFRLIQKNFFGQDFTYFDQI